MNKREIGREYEGKACHYLESKGFRIVARNFRCRQGEIDIIGYDGEYLVFLEVKYRARSSSGHPAEAVTAASRRKYAGRPIITAIFMGLGMAVPCGMMW